MAVFSSRKVDRCSLALPATRGRARGHRSQIEASRGYCHG